MAQTSFPARFGQLIRQRRRELDITQADLATRIRISQAAISSWEHGGSTPTAEALLGLLHALQLTLVDVVELLEEPDGEAA
jgi:transcriptional regulator with XRE-family HTH domain